MVNSQWLEGFGIYEVEYSQEYAGIIGKKSDWYLYTDNGTYQVYPESIGERTNYKDLNGKYVFKGDVFDMGEGIALVMFEDDGFKLHWYDYADESTQSGYSERTGNFELLESYYISSYTIDKLEIIGNIFENELLAKQLGFTAYLKKEEN